MSLATVLSQSLRRPGAALLAALSSLPLGCGPAAAPVTPPPVISIGSASPPIEPPASAAPSSAKPPPPRLTAIVWETSEADARDRARRTGKPLLVYFRAAWATAALQMERSVWTDPGIIALVERFVPLRIDVTEAEGDAEAFAQTYGITSVPEIVIHGATGMSVTAIPGAPAVEPLTAILRRALDDD